MRRAVEKLGDVHRHVIVRRRQFTLGQPLQRAQRGLNPRLGADDVVEHLLALVVGHVEGGQHLEIGAHRRQGRAQLVGGHRSEVASRSERLLGPDLLVPDALQHAAHRLGDFDGFARTVHFDARRLIARIDRAGLLSQLFERAHREGRQQPREYGRRADGEPTDK